MFSNITPFLFFDFQARNYMITRCGEILIWSEFQVFVLHPPNPPWHFRVFIVEINMASGAFQQLSSDSQELFLSV